MTPSALSASNCLALLADARWFRPGASTFAENVDTLFMQITWVCVFFFVLVVGLMVWFMWVYRARQGHREQPSAHHNNMLEVTWSVIPTIIVIWMFYQGFVGYIDMTTPPDNSEVIEVVAQKWSWSFKYPNGAISPVLHVPKDRPVKLLLSSKDVLHSLYIPAFRTKMDCVPGRYTELWFNATVASEDANDKTFDNDTDTGNRYTDGSAALSEAEPSVGYDLFCTEYCGTGHSSMITKCVVHTEASYQEELKNLADPRKQGSPIEVGEKLYKERGCAQCHSIDGKDNPGNGGPSFKGHYGKEVKFTPASAEPSAKMDDNYIRESILYPQKNIREGYRGIMPTFQGQLNEDEIYAIRQYIRSLNDETAEDWLPREQEEGEEGAASAERQRKNPLKRPSQSNQPIPLSPGKGEGVEGHATSTNKMIAHTNAPSFSVPTGTRIENPQGPSYLTGGGVMSWAFTLDHKRIGVMYLVGVLTAFLLGGVMALLVRTELLTPEAKELAFMAGSQDAAAIKDAYNVAFTLHGAIMVFLFIIPSIPAALGNFVLPMQLGAKDVAFPRLNLASFHLWVVGAIFFFAALTTTGLDTGWTFYTPYSTTTSGPVIFATLGVFILGFSSIFTGINFIVTVNTMRPKGMTWFRMPLFLWSVYATAIIQVLATPVLAITVLLLTVERVMGIGIFDPALGGDPVLYQHFFWFYSHPAVYIMILPAMGVISEVIPVFARKHIFGYTFIAYSSIAIALLSFLVWGHHMFTSGQSELATVIFSFLTFSVSIPSAIKVFNWLSTLYKGNIHYKAPMVYCLVFLFLFTVGGLTGLHLGTLATDRDLHDTYFVVSHFHYVMMGGTLIAFLAGLHHWWPKMFGKMYNELGANIAAIVICVGFNLTFFPQFILGTQGMPRRYATYKPEFQTLHQLSTMGSYLLGVGLVMCALVLLHSLIRGRKASDNPWGAATLEWKCCSPPTHHNFEVNPHMDSPYVYDNFVRDPDGDGYYEVLPDFKRETKPAEQPVQT